MIFDDAWVMGRRRIYYATVGTSPEPILEGIRGGGWDQIMLIHDERTKPDAETLQESIEGLYPGAVHLLEVDGKEILADAGRIFLATQIAPEGYDAGGQKDGGEDSGKTKPEAKINQGNTWPWKDQHHVINVSGGLKTLVCAASLAAIQAKASMFYIPDPRHGAGGARSRQRPIEIPFDSLKGLQDLHPQSNSTKVNIFRAIGDLDPTSPQPSRKELFEALGIKHNTGHHNVGLLMDIGVIEAAPMLAGGKPPSINAERPAGPETSGPKTQPLRLTPIGAKVYSRMLAFEDAAGKPDVQSVHLANLGARQEDDGTFNFDPVAKVLDVRDPCDRICLIHGHSDDDQAAAHAFQEQHANFAGQIESMPADVTDALDCMLNILMLKHRFPNARFEANFTAGTKAMGIGMVLAGLLTGMDLLYRYWPGERGGEADIIEIPSIQGGFLSGMDRYERDLLVCLAERLGDPLSNMATAVSLADDIKNNYSWRKPASYQLIGSLLRRLKAKGLVADEDANGVTLTQLGSIAAQMFHSL